MSFTTRLAIRKVEPKGSWFLMYNTHVLHHQIGNSKSGALESIMKRELDMISEIAACSVWDVPEGASVSTVGESLASETRGGGREAARFQKAAGPGSNCKTGLSWRINIT